MGFRDFLQRHRILCLVLLDICAVLIYVICIPSFGRPFDALLIVVFVVGIINALVVRKPLLQNALLLVISLAAVLFGAEMMQKKFNILDMPLVEAWEGNLDREYVWRLRNGPSYYAAITKARKAGEDFFLPTEFDKDVFLSGISPDNRITSVKYDSSWQDTMVTNKPMYIPHDTLAYELNPDARVFLEITLPDEPEKELLQCGYTVSSHGLRPTKGNPDSGEVAIFIGCSFTFGLYCSDDQTLPHYFSQASGFVQNVINLAVPGYGPHQCLYDLVNDYHAGKVVSADATVQGVYYTLIDDHIMRVSPPSFDRAPLYDLVNGKLRYKGSFDKQGAETKRTSLQQILDSSRLYTPLRDRIFGTMSDQNMNYRWDLVIAMLVETDQLCRARYGVPLTIVYWDDNYRRMEEMREQGLDIIPVSDAFGQNWRESFIKYSFHDYHPTPYANKVLGDFLYSRKRQYLHGVGFTGN